jgi:receptor protein-tyrosine kinase
LSLEQIFTLLWRRRWSFLLAFAVTLGVAAAVTFTLPKVYETEALVLITPDREGNFDITQTSEVLTTTYAELAETRGVVDAVLGRLPFRTTAGDLESAVDISSIVDSQLIRITVQERSPVRAQAIANTYGQVFVERVRRLGQRDGTGNAAGLAAPAAQIESAARPRPKLYMAIAFVLALCAGALMALLRHQLDRRLQVGSDTTELLGVPVIARIPERAVPLRQSLIMARGRGQAADERLADAFRLLLANLSFVNRGARPATIAVVSAGEAEGKSTCSVSIGQAAAELGIKAAVVDGDLRRPSLAGMLDGDPSQSSQGLSGFLANPVAFDKLPIETSVSALRLIPAGDLSDNPAALLGSGALTIFERLAKTEFDLVVYDTPPMTVGADAALIAATVEAVVLVVDVKRTNRFAATRVVDQLRRSGANVVGVVINRASDQGDSYDYYTGPQRFQGVKEPVGGRA